MGFGRTIAVSVPFCVVLLAACSGGGGGFELPDGDDASPPSTQSEGGTGIVFPPYPGRDAGTSPDEEEEDVEDASVSDTGTTTPIREAGADADAGGTNPPGPRCGDGICNGSETQGSCCRDCGCAAGSTCNTGSNTCQANPRCGDGICNGSETQGSCCADCGCSNGQTCSGGTCVTPPRCGDGICNGSETQSSCCGDCGCPSGQSCQGGSCRCTQGVLHLTSALQNRSEVCFGVSPPQSYTQRAVAYVNTGGQLYYIPQGGYIDFTRNIPTTMTGTQQCCMIDPCLGNLTCQTPTGPAPCICLASRSWSANVNSCNVNSVLCN